VYKGTTHLYIQRLLGYKWHYENDPSDVIGIYVHWVHNYETMRWQLLNDFSWHNNGRWVAVMLSSAGAATGSWPRNASLIACIPAVTLRQLIGTAYRRTKGI